MLESAGSEESSKEASSISIADGCAALVEDRATSRKSRKAWLGAKRMRDGKIRRRYPRPINGEQERSQLIGLDGKRMSCDRFHPPASQGLMNGEACEISIARPSMLASVDALSRGEREAELSRDSDPGPPASTGCPIEGDPKRNHPWNAPAIGTVYGKVNWN